jgi:hypothetical protein
MAPIARAECEVGSLKGVHKKAPQPFLPHQGHLQTPSFQLSEPCRNLPKALAAWSTAWSQDWQTAKTQNAGAGSKAQAQAAERHCAEF